VQAVLRNSSVKVNSQKFNEKDEALSEALKQCQAKVDAALKDSFDTPTAILVLSELVSHANVYMKQASAEIKEPLLRQTSRYVFHILKCFGLYGDDDTPSSVGEDGAGQSSEETIAPLMNALSNYRDKVKESAKDGAGPIFKISDQLRDDVLPYMGIKLEDKKPGEPASWMFVDKDVLIKEIEAKVAAKAAKEAEKLAKAAALLKKNSTPGIEYFRVFEADKWPAIDAETGLPTKNAKGGDISEAQLNTCKKQMAKQQKVYEKWLETHAAQEEKKE